MPSKRWLKRFARALRDLATHAHMRAELLPRMPFVIALVVSAVALVAAVEHRPGTEAEVASVDELPSVQPEEYSDEAAFVEEEVELEIVEQGFSMVTDDAGEEFVLVAVVVRNPHDGELVPGSLSIQTTTERGYPVNLDTIYLGWLPPHSTAAFGYVMPVGAGEYGVEDLTLEQLDPTMLYPSEFWDDELQLDSALLPTFSFTGLEPLVSPDGYRVHFRAETPEESDAQIAVLFRDSEGRLLGGLPAGSGYYGYTGGARTFPAGESAQYVDVTAEWIPEGADLDRIEIGPSRF
ncbi:hypothetical protein O1R50_06805 [Glycomyces luteolus]|uniref:Uncharacterized protein n=1 Tax=Glycomyces luteolus TaxID=2670330 RepID=A0A9X3SSJ8_9ACTN|nr:hypothetical protein [Glycomyces luteolus]MDA1359323.1 hypothetical protein [Glycomyces luteolus]